MKAIHLIRHAMYKKVLILLLAFFILDYIINISMSLKKLDLDNAIIQGILVLAMRSIDVVKAVGEPTSTSGGKYGITGWYYKDMENPVVYWKLEYVYLSFESGRLCDIRDGKAPNKKQE